MHSKTLCFKNVGHIEDEISFMKISEIMTHGK